MTSWCLIVFQESADHLSLSVFLSFSMCPSSPLSRLRNWLDVRGRRWEVVVAVLWARRGSTLGRAGPCAEVGPHKKRGGLGSRLRLSSLRRGQTRASWSAPSGSSSSSCCWACASSRETAGMLRWVTNLQTLRFFFPHFVKFSTDLVIVNVSSAFFFFFLKNNEISKDELYSFFNAELKRETPEELMFRRPLRKSERNKTN